MTTTRRGSRRTRVAVVGAGISGLACARVLLDAGIAVAVFDRGRGIGGRMSSVVDHGRAIDMGASYFTVKDPDFAALVARWEAAGLARPWTDTFAVAEAHGLAGSKTGPMRWGTGNGLRSLLLDLAEAMSIRHPYEVEDVDPGPSVDGDVFDAVALAMPDPQAADLISDALPRELAILSSGTWAPVVSVAAGWGERCWPDLDGVFVNGSERLAWVADDGRRRGDGAPVLVAHATPEFSQAHLDAPEGAVGPLLDDVRRLLGIVEPPTWTRVRRWSLAKPTNARPQTHYLGDAMIGLCGDGWAAPSRVEGAWLSGRALGVDIARRLSGRTERPGPPTG